MKYSINVVVNGLIIRGATVYESYEEATKTLNRMMAEYRGRYGFVSMN